MVLWLLLIFIRSYMNEKGGILYRSGYPIVTQNDVII